MIGLDMASIVSCVSATVAAIGSIGAIVVALYVNHQAHLPYVIAFLRYDSDQYSVSLVVKNVGNGVARDVRLVGFDYTMAIGPPAKDVLSKGFIERGIPVLVPGGSRETIVNAGKNLEKSLDKTNEVEVSYSVKTLLGSKRLSERFTLDFYSFAGNLHIDSEEKRSRIALEKIAERVCGQ